MFILQQQNGHIIDIHTPSQTARNYHIVDQLFYITHPLSLIRSPQSWEIAETSDAITI